LKSILLVEDEPTIADAISFALTQDGFEVAVVSTLGDARLALQKARPALIVLDVGLPDGNGFEFCKEIRLTTDTPIIFLTARSDEIDRVVGLELGADDYMVKPFSPRELAARVRAVLRRLIPSAGNLQGSENSISPGLANLKGAYDFAYNGIRLKLTKYEYGILSTLFGSPGRVYTREQLMTYSWEDPDMSLERTIDAHIKSIRSKLRLAGSDPEIILTHRGIGYALRKDL